MGNMLYATAPAEEVVPVEETPNLSSSILIVDSEETPNLDLDTDLSSSILIVDSEGNEEVKSVSVSYADAVKNHDRGYPKEAEAEPKPEVEAKALKPQINAKGKRARRRRRKFRPIPKSKNSFEELAEPEPEPEPEPTGLVHDKDTSYVENCLNEACWSISSCPIKYLGYRIHHPESQIDACLISVENSHSVATASSTMKYMGTTLRISTPDDDAVHLNDIRFKLPVFKILVYDVTGEYERQVFDDFHVSSNVWASTQVNGRTGEFCDNNLGKLTPMPKNWITDIKLPYKTVNFSSDKVNNIVISGNFIADHQYLVKFWNYNFGIIKKSSTRSPEVNLKYCS
jgi:hypothetical protein